MIEFMNKAMDWVLEKEEVASKNGNISLVDVDKQLENINSKKDALTKQYEENIAQLDHVIDRLKVIKSNANKFTN